jgi:hypothetical protein
MRFRIEVEVCVQANSIEELDELQAQAEQAVRQAVADRHITDPDDGSAAVSAAEGLDAASNAALDAAATE